MTEARLGWLWVARPRKCGACGEEVPIGGLAYLTKAGLVRCRDCWEDVLGVCQLGYDTAPLERLDYVPKLPAPTLDGLEGLRTTLSQPTMTETELRSRQARHARRLERWRERNNR